MKLTKKLISACAALIMATSVMAENPQVTIKTNQGDITLRLFEDRAPITVENFLAYVDSGHYRGTIFHRVIPGFMIQGGGFNERMEQQPTNSPIKNEASNGLSNERGTIAMARTSAPDSATSQFFINHRDNAGLDWSAASPGYAVFGQVVEGMRVVDAIAQVPTGSVGGHQNVPQQPVVITDVVRVGAEGADEWSR